ncbi:hypothetical protein DFH07DRAFT_1068573 [Mycena maculata]|uniref:Uncharacterized protein n=1 Tax=Mycena maculata TaxID=230809 RepID=A0AAD7MFU5_9AGAR|nr:hypothetical protein DFH07DRAFT_1068573 [Mycena maculata]
MKFTSQHQAVRRNPALSQHHSRGKTYFRAVIIRKRDGTPVSLNVCGRLHQAGLKWLESAGFSLRCSYNGYTTLTFIVSLELEATLPLPDLVKNTILVYGFVSHLESGPTTFGLVKTDNNTMQLLVGNNGDSDLPRLASEVVPFLSNFRRQAPIPSWVLETIRILCENGSPSFDNITISTQSYVRYHMVPAGALPSNCIAIQLNPIHSHQGFTKIVLNSITLNPLLNTVDPRSNNLPRDFAARYFKNDVVTAVFEKIEGFRKSVTLDFCLPLLTDGSPTTTGILQLRQTRTQTRP